MRVLLAIALLINHLLAQSIAFPGPGTAHTTGGGGTAPAFVREADCHWFGGSGTSEACAFGANPSAGDAVVVFVGWATPGSTISSVQDAAPTSYSNQAWASGAANCNSAGGDTRVYFLPNSAGGANAKTITVTWSADPGFGTISMFEVSGANASAPVDVADCSITATTTAPASPSVATSTVDFLGAFSFDDNGNGRTWTAGTSPAYTFRGTNGSWFGQESFSQTSSGTVTGNFTTNANVIAHTAVIGLKQ